MDFSEVVTQDQRLRVLHILQKDPEGAHNEHVLRAALELAGHRGISAQRICDIVP